MRTNPVALTDEELAAKTTELREKVAGGASLVMSAPIDALYAASELNEWAYAACANELDGADEPDFEATVAAL